MKTRTILLAILALCLGIILEYGLNKMRQPTTFYLKATSNYYCVLEVYVVDDLDNKITLIDHIDTCEPKAIQVMDMLETQPGWETPMDASMAYYRLKLK